MRDIELTDIGIDLFHQIDVFMLHESHLISIWSSLLLLCVVIIANGCSIFKRVLAISAPVRRVDGCRRQRKRETLGFIALKSPFIRGSISFYYLNFAFSL